MRYNEYKNTYGDTNECTSRGACSIAPNIAALQELIMYFLKQLAHYIIKLEKHGANNKTIKYEVINDIAALVSINEFSEEQLFSIILKDYYLLEDTKKTYKQLCAKEKLPYAELKTKVEFNKSTSVAKAIGLGEKLFLEKYNKLTTEQKNLAEILQIVIKSTCINLSKLNDIKEFDDSIYHEILQTLDMLNTGKFQTEKVKAQTQKLAQMDNELQIKISKELLKKFDGIRKVQVSHSTRKGKAILVSGNNFLDLLEVLEETKDKNIDIYTHSNLLICHALEKFQKYEHLRGHYGDTSENFILDFATFPGSILLTKNAKKNTEYLYRGRLFSNDYIVPKGVVKIENNNYDELIESALNAKGFAKGKTKPDTTLGYNENKLEAQINELTKKLSNGEIERLFIIGMNPYSEVQKEYFREFLSKLNKKEYAISFSTEYEQKNILTLNIGNYQPLATNILQKLFKKFPITSEKIFFFFTKCDVMTISNIITLNNYKAKNIYMADCPPTLVNPSVFSTFRQLYNVSLTHDAYDDLSTIREK